MTSQEVTIPSADGEFMGYLAMPDSGSGPGIVVIQEIFGVNAFMRSTADYLASVGYVALSPDLFWRIEPGIQLTDQSEEEWQKAFALYEKFDVDKGVEDIASTVSFLRGHDSCNGKVGGVGYCLGGLLAYLTAARTDADAAVGYYGVGIQDKLGEAGNISKPLMLHIAEKDGFVPPDAQKAVADGLSSNSNVTIHSYPDVDHAFARDGGEHYDKAAADLANGRTLDFFKNHLG